MKKYRARYTPETSSRIRRLHPLIMKEIKDGIQTLLESHQAGYALHFDLAGYWSYRVRNYRIIYKVDDDNSSLDIVFVGPRRNIYEDFRLLLLKDAGSK